MCDECKRSFCPQECPNNSGISAEFGFPSQRCSHCGQALYQGDEFFSDGDILICTRCSEELTIEELVSVCGLESPAELFEELGFRIGEAS